MNCIASGPVLETAFPSTMPGEDVAELARIIRLAAPRSPPNLRRHTSCWRAMKQATFRELQSPSPAENR